MENKQAWIIGGSIIAGLFGLFGVALLLRPPVVQPPAPIGSVAKSEAYISTTTNANTSKEMYLTSSTDFGSVDITQTRQGILGSVILTGSNRGGGMLSIYDATTTNINQRQATMVSNTLVLANIPTEGATGTYVFDARFVNGLIAVFTGPITSTTITWK